jgi:hypothetical protein
MPCALNSTFTDCGPEPATGVRISVNLLPQRAASNGWLLARESLASIRANHPAAVRQYMSRYGFKAHIRARIALEAAHEKTA